MNIDKLFQHITIVDVETTSTDTDEAEVVELGTCRFDGSWACKSQLFGTLRPIPPEASAIHHISNRMVKGLTRFVDNLDTASDQLCLDSTSYMVAHNADYDRKVLASSYQRGLGSFDPFDAKMKWLCTWRLAKAILNVDYNRQKYGLSYLRYYLDLDVADSLVSHRTDTDTLACGQLLIKLIELGFENGKINTNDDIDQQLLTLCYTPAKVETWPFGKHKGEKLDSIPNDYFFWAMDNIDALNEKSEKYNEDLATSVTKILESRI